MTLSGAGVVIRGLNLPDLGEYGVGMIFLPAGDCVLGASLVVKAINQVKQAMEFIDGYLGK